MYLKAYLIKTLELISLVLILSLNAQAAITLSDKAEVSLITCGAGEDLYEAFGHTAIRVYDQKNAINLVYNYGIFSFNQPNFYANFAMGHLWYQLGVNDFDRFVYTYEYYQRSVYEQVLNFNAEQKQVLFDSLENNLKPENKFYLYDYFFNNCSTIPRDILEYASGNSVQYNYAAENFSEGKSIRNLIDEYLIHNSWGNFGIDLGLGAKIDKKASFHEYLYLPEYLMQAYNSAEIISDGNVVPLVKRQIVHYQSPINYLERNISPGPIPVFWVLFGLILLLTIWGFKKKKAFKALDFTIFFILGITGTVVFFISFCTDHNAAAQNYNLLWNLPTHLIFAFILLRKKQGNLSKYYLIFSIFLCLLLLLDDLILPQSFHPANIPVLLSIILRSGYMLWFRKHSIAKAN